MLSGLRGWAKQLAVAVVRKTEVSGFSGSAGHLTVASRTNVFGLTGSGRQLAEVVVGKMEVSGFGGWARHFVNDGGRRNKGVWTNRLGQATSNDGSCCNGSSGNSMAGERAGIHDHSVVDKTAVVTKLW